MLSVIPADNEEHDRHRQRHHLRPQRRRLAPDAVVHAREVAGRLRSGTVGQANGFKVDYGIGFLAGSNSPASAARAESKGCFPYLEH